MGLASQTPTEHDGDNDWIVAQVDDGYLYLGSPYSIYADFNSGFQEWYLPAGWQYVLDKFDYEVVSFDWNGNSDYAGSASFDLSRLPAGWGLTDQAPYYTIVNAYFWVEDWFSYVNAGIKGMMVVDYNGQPGAGQSYFWEMNPYGNFFAPMFFE